MNVSLPTSPPRPLQAPVFTVGSALRWLDHDCPDHRCCFDPIDTLSASVWFLRLRSQSRTFPAHARVLVHGTEIGDPRGSIRSLIYHVHACTARDGIEVRYAPGCAGDRPERSTPHRVPVALLTRYRPAHPLATPGPSDDDLRGLMEASR